MVAPVLGGCLSGYSYLWGARLALEPTLLTLGLAVLLIELLVLRYRKISFASLSRGLRIMEF